MIETLKNTPSDAKAEDIQTKIYDIGMSLNFEKIKKIGSLVFYEVILGQSQGPRLGSFIRFYGIDKTIKLLETKIEQK